MPFSFPKILEFFPTMFSFLFSAVCLLLLKDIFLTIHFAACYLCCRPVFRNYKPQNEQTVGEVLPQEISGDIEATVQSQLEVVMAPGTVDEIDLTNLAPRKPDWDLKRDVAKKLEKLERRTQKAIAELIRVRLKGDDNHQELEKVVNVGAAASSIAPTINTEDDY